MEGNDRREVIRSTQKASVGATYERTFLVAAPVTRAHP